MFLRKTCFAAALAVSLWVPTFAHGETATVPAINAEKAAKAAGDMFRSYREGGAGGMLSLENTCWAGLGLNGSSDSQAVPCAVMALAGAFIEAGYAQQERRVPVPAYNGQTFKQRVFDSMANAGIGKDRAQSVLESALVNHQGPILVGLMNAGMR